MILELPFKDGSLRFFLPSARWQQTCSIDKGCSLQRAIKASRWLRIDGSLRDTTDPSWWSYARCSSTRNFLAIAKLWISSLTLVDINSGFKSLPSCVFGHRVWKIHQLSRMSIWYEQLNYKFANESLASTADCVDTRFVVRDTRDCEKS